MGVRVRVILGLGKVVAGRVAKVDNGRGWSR